MKATNNTDAEDLASEHEQDLFEHYKIVADKGQQLLRIDKFLVDRLPDTSRNRIQNAAIAGTILVNGNTVKPNYKVKPGDVVSIVLPYPPRDIELIAENIPLDIIYEDEHLVIVNKPAGLVVHPGYGNYTGTMLNGLIYYFGLTNSAVPGLVHRLDKYTTGLMVVAKTEIALTKLAKEFYDRTVERTYIALVWGDVKENEGTICGNIGRNLKNRKVMSVFTGGDHGKHAVTHYKVIERFGYVTLVECKLETGRTHQIRVHFKHIGHTLFNDIEYGGDKILKGTAFSKYNQFIKNCFDMIPGQALHAKSLGFIHPAKGERIYFVAAPPDGMKKLIDKWSIYTGQTIIPES